MDGVNIYAEDVETAIAAAISSDVIRHGAIAAFSVDDGTSEHLVVVYEHRLSDARETSKAIVRAVLTSTVGVRPSRVVAITPRTIPRTTSGKIRRRATRDALISGAMTNIIDDLDLRPTMKHTNDPPPPPEQQQLFPTGSSPDHAPPRPAVAFEEEDKGRSVGRRRPSFRPTSFSPPKRQISMKKMLSTATSVATSHKSLMAVSGSARILRHAVRVVADRGRDPFFIWLNDKGKEESTYSFRGIWDRAGIVGQHIRTMVNKQDRVLLCYAPGPEFYIAFWACLRTAVVAVPVYPPNPSRMAASIEKLSLVHQSSNARLCLTDNQVSFLKRTKGFFHTLQPVSRTNVAGDFFHEYCSLVVCSSSVKIIAVAFVPASKLVHVSEPTV